MWRNYCFIKNITLGHSFVFHLKWYVVLYHENSSTPKALFTRRENADISMWPFIYTKTLFLSQKTIISKNSGQSGDFGKLWFRSCM